MRASIVVLGPLLARCGDARRSRCPAATTSARGRSTCTSAGWSGWARRSGSSTASSMRRAPTGCAAPPITLDYPSVGATENLLMAAVARARHDRDRQRGARAGDRRPRRRSWSRWARGSTAPAPARSRSRASTSCAPTDHTAIARPHRGRHVGEPRPSRRAATSRSRARGPTTSRCCSAKLADAGADGRSRRRRPAGPAADARRAPSTS